MSEWQDISTAPKDGTRILGLDQVGWIEIIRWEGIWLDDSMDCPDWDPVLWMPLPKPPVDSPPEP